VKKYKITLKHDNGRFSITTTAVSLEAATRIVLNAEGAPASAIIKTQEVNG
jgi:hypothetical protein